MKRRVVLLLVLAGLAVPFVAAPALADPPTAAPRGVLVVPTVTVTGRPDKPMVAIMIRRPTAAAEAGAAHAQLRDLTLARSEPATLRSP